MTGKKDGFTLIEIIIVISILGLVMTIFSGFLLATLRAGSKSEVVKELRQNGNYALQTIDSMLRNSVSLQSSCNLGGQSSIQIRNIDNGITVFKCEASHLASNSGLLTGANVVVSNCSFQCLAQAGQAPAITTKFSISQTGSGSPSDKAQLNFESVTILRNIIFN